MAWDCPHNNNNECIMRNKPCQPLDNGCVLKGKLKFAGSNTETSSPEKNNKTKEK